MSEATAPFFSVAQMPSVVGGCARHWRTSTRSCRPLNKPPKSPIQADDYIRGTRVWMAPLNKKRKTKKNKKSQKTNTFFYSLDIFRATIASISRADRCVSWCLRVFLDVFRSCRYPQELQKFRRISMRSEDAPKGYIDPYEAPIDLQNRPILGPKNV